MSMEYSGGVVGTITANKTYVTIPYDDAMTIVFECGDRSIEIPWRELFVMLESAIAAWNRRAE